MIPRLGNIFANRAAEQRSPQPPASAVSALSNALSALPAPWIVLRNQLPGSSDGPPWVNFIALHPRRGLALIDIEPAQPGNAVAPLEEFLARTGFAAFAFGGPPVVAVPLTVQDIPAVAQRLREAFSHAPLCRLTNAHWADALADLLLATQDLMLRRLPPTARRAPDEAEQEPAPPRTAPRMRRRSTPTATAAPPPEPRIRPAVPPRSDPPRNEPPRSEAPPAPERVARPAAAEPKVPRAAAEPKAPPESLPPEVDAALASLAAKLAPDDPPARESPRTDDAMSAPSEASAPEREPPLQAPPPADAAPPLPELGPRLVIENERERPSNADAAPRRRTEPARRPVVEQADRPFYLEPAAPRRRNKALWAAAAAIAAAIALGIAYPHYADLISAPKSQDEASQAPTPPAAQAEQNLATAGQVAGPAAPTPAAPPPARASASPPTPPAVAPPAASAELAKSEPTPPRPPSAPAASKAPANAPTASAPAAEAEAAAAPHHPAKTVARKKRAPHPDAVARVEATPPPWGVSGDAKSEPPREASRADGSRNAASERERRAPPADRLAARTPPARLATGEPQSLGTGAPMVSSNEPGRASEAIPPVAGLPSQQQNASSSSSAGSGNGTVTIDGITYVQGRQPHPLGTLDSTNSNGNSSPPAAPASSTPQTPIADAAPPAQPVPQGAPFLSPLTSNVRSGNGLPLPNDVIVMPNGQMVVPPGAHSQPAQ